MSDFPVAGTTLVDVLRFRLLDQPDKRALTFLAEGEKETAHLTYRDLDRRARVLAAKLQRSVARGERVLLVCPPGLEFVVGFFGCLYAGVIAVPVYLPRPNRPMARLQTILADSGASVALTTGSSLQHIFSRFPFAPDLAALQWLITDAEDEDGGEEWNDSHVSADSIAFLQYTSGSTSAPKGVMVSHANIMHNERMIQLAFGHSENTVIVSWLPLFHDMGLIGQLLQTLYVGGSCILMPPLVLLQRPVLWLRAISQYRATTSGGPNFAYDLCVRKISPEERKGLDLSSWSVAFNGAEPVRLRTLEQFSTAFAPCGFKKAALYSCYGLAEATLFVAGGPRNSETTVSHARENGLPPLVGCGHSWLGQRIRIVDTVSRSALPDGEVGEIWVSGASVAQGYWERRELTELTFRATLADSDEGPFLRTGDLGFFSGGELFVTGRLKDLIIIRGRNIYPQDIEQTVEACDPAFRPGCGGAFSVEIEDEERLIVVQEVEQRHRTDLDELAGAVRQAVAEEHEVPVYDVVLLRPGAFPKTTSGKVQRQECKARFLDATLQGVLFSRGSFVAPRPERALAVRSGSS